MTLTDGQFEFRGLVMGPDTDYPINRVEGFEGADLRVSDSDQPRNDGGLRGLDYVAPRTVAIELVTLEVDTADGDGSVYESRWSAIRDAFRPSRETDYDLVYKRPGQVEKVIRARPIQLVRVEGHSTYSRVNQAPVVLRAVDPRVYSSVEYSGNVSAYTAAGGGLDLPIAQFPGEFGSGQQTELVVENNGTADAFPLIRFYGPVAGTCTAVTLTNTTTGQTLVITTPVTTGQILTADMDAAVTGANRLVISLGGSSRYGSWSLPREPFALAPGTNTLRFQVTGTSVDVICNILWRDTWLD